MIFSRWVFIAPVLCSTSKYVEKLYTDLFISYNKAIRPIVDTAVPVTVTVELYLYKILDLDERNQMLNSYLWMRQRWVDWRLNWSEKTYDGISFNIQNNIHYRDLYSIFLHTYYYFSPIFH